MGSADDWRPIMHALSATHHCVAIDLPGHANTRLTGEYCKREVKVLVMTIRLLKSFTMSGQLNAAGCVTYDHLSTKKYAALCKCSAI